MKTLILGGVRSGKSRYAERVALASGLPVTYVATAEPADAEMRARIAVHEARRPSSWQLVEEPIRLAPILRERARPGQCLLVECLSVWLANVLHRDAGHECDALEKLLPGLAGDVLFVSTESSLGLVPPNDLARRYLDDLGRLHQRVASACERVVLVIAGIPLQLKPSP